MLLAAGLLIGLLSAGLILLVAQPRQGVPIQLEPAPTLTPTGVPGPSPTPEPILVQVGGAIAQPGVYTLPCESRLDALIQAAGGLTSDADVDRINYAVQLRDGDYYYLPMPNETLPETATNAPQNLQAAENGISYPINLNTATQEELESLPGIGPSKAADILAYRDSHGPFLTLEDLANVSGIGPTTVEALCDYLYLD
jgi:competence protein ComEA